MDLTKNPLENAQSLLDDARANRRQQEKRSDRSLLLNLAGQVIGNVLQGRQVEKFNTFMNKKNVMDERAVVRSAVDKAQNVAERARTAASYEGGKDAYFRNELVQTYKASLDTRLAADGKPYSETHVQRLAEKMASESLPEYIKAFEAQLEQAQNVISTTGGDRLAYAKALREASGVDQGVMGRGLRKLTSYFLDEEDRNTDAAVYRSVTSDEIYRTSKEFKDSFDKFYSTTGDSFIAAKITEHLKETGDLPLAAKSKKIISLTTRNEFGETVTESWLQINGYDGNPESFISTDGNAERLSVSSWLKRKSDGQRNGTRMKPDAAMSVFAEATNALDSTGLGSLREAVTEKLPDNATAEQRDAVIAVFGEQIYLGRKALETTLGDKTTRSQLTGIAARAQVLDRKAFDQRPTLLAGNTRAHPFTTWQATIEHFGGDYEEVPVAIRTELETQMNYFFSESNLNAMSNQDLRDVKRFTKGSGTLGYFGNVFDDEDIFRLYGRTGPTILEKLNAEIARRKRS